MTVVLWRWNECYAQVLRVLLPRGPLHLSALLQKHLRDAVVELRFQFDECGTRLSDVPADSMITYDYAQLVDWMSAVVRSISARQITYLQVDPRLLEPAETLALIQVARESRNVGNFYVESEQAFTMGEISALLINPLFTASTVRICGVSQPTATEMRVHILVHLRPSRLCGD